jgi:hypothetical protein
MTDTDQRAFVESVFERNQRRDAEINEALKQENARREAAVKKHVPPEGVAFRTRSKSQR